MRSDVVDHEVSPMWLFMPRVRRGCPWCESCLRVLRALRCRSR